MSRQDIVNWAISQIGPFSQTAVDGYWKGVLPPSEYHPGIKLAWCGAFALNALHAAGYDTDKHWRFGLGFLLVPPHALPVTYTTQPGDIGYQAKPFQHHFVVEFVAGNVVHSIDGNQPQVCRRTRTISSALTFYSVQPLLDARDTPVDPPKSSHETIWFGSRGAEVVLWQHVLFLAGYPRQTDGVFGSHTLLYTQQYQTKHGLKADGIVGALTWATVKP